MERMKHNSGVKKIALSMDVCDNGGRESLPRVVIVGAGPGESAQLFTLFLPVLYNSLCNHHLFLSTYQLDYFAPCHWPPLGSNR